MTGRNHEVPPKRDNQQATRESGSHGVAAASGRNSNAAPLWFGAVALWLIAIAVGVLAFLAYEDRDRDSALISNCAPRVTISGAFITGGDCLKVLLYER